MKKIVCKGILKVCDVIDLLEESLIVFGVMFGLPIIGQIICELIFLKLGV